MGVWDSSHVISSGTEGDATRFLSVLIGMHVFVHVNPRPLPHPWEELPNRAHKEPEGTAPFSNETAERGRKRKRQYESPKFLSVIVKKPFGWAVALLVLVLVLVLYPKMVRGELCCCLTCCVRLRWMCGCRVSGWRFLIASAANKHKLNHTEIWLGGFTFGWPLVRVHVISCVAFLPKHLSFSSDAKSGLNDHNLYSFPSLWQVITFLSASNP